MKKSLYIGGFCLLAGMLIGHYVFPASFSSSDTEGSELRQKGTYTNPLLECEMGSDTIGSRKEDFTPELRDFVEELRGSTQITDIGVYFRDLNNGPVIGYNHTEEYAPASLLKIPIMISYLRWSEDVPSVLDEKILYETPINVGYTQQFAPTVPLEVGKTYSARELLEHMIHYSDNQALMLLYERLPKNYQEDLFRLVGIDEALITDPTATLSVRQYSIFFRMLFNASFLSRKNSEYALKLLTETTFTEGIRSTVPEGVDVAHKFGERKVEPEGLQQFHDCGIVYYPNHPYLLCIMTRGTEPAPLITAIQDVSRFVYQKIDEQYTK